MFQEHITEECLLRKNPSLKAFIFDLDGTLLDSQKGIVQTLTTHLISKGHSINKEDVSTLFGKPIEVVFKTLIPSLTDEEIWNYVKEVREKYSKNHLEITQPFPKTKTVLENIKIKGYKLALASTKFRIFIIEALDHFNFTNYFDVIVSGYEVKNHKPAPDIIIEAAKQLGIKLSECVYIGDSISDIEAGRSAGTTTIAVLTGAASKEQMLTVNADFVIHSLDSLIL